MVETLLLHLGAVGDRALLLFPQIIPCTPSTKPLRHISLSTPDKLSHLGMTSLRTSRIEILSKSRITSRNWRCTPKNSGSTEYRYSEQLYTVMKWTCSFWLTTNHFQSFRRVVMMVETHWTGNSWHWKWQEVTQIHINPMIKHTGHVLVMKFWLLANTLLLGSWH